MSKRKRIRATVGTVLLLVASTVIVFAPHLNNAFEFDDYHSIVENPAIQSFSNWRAWMFDIGAFSVLPENLNYRPLLLASYAVSYRIAKLEPWGFRLLNGLIHLAVAFLVYEIARRLLTIARAGPTQMASSRSLTTPEAEGLGLLAGLMFLLHPAHSEPVNYISARSESLAAGFVLMAFAIRLAADRASADGRHSKAGAMGAASVAAYVLGLLTKEIALTFPLLVIWHDLVLGDQMATPVVTRHSPLAAAASRLRPRLGYLFALGAVTSGYLLWRARLITPAVAAARSGVGRMTYFVTQLRAWPHYLREFVWPADLHVDNTDFGWSSHLAEPRVLAALGVIAVLALFAWGLRRWAPLVGFGLGWFWISLLPTSSLFPLAEPVNGHRAYLGGVGLVLSSVALLGAGIGSRPEAVRAPGRRIALRAAAAGFLLILGLLTWERGRVWESPQSLWAEVVARSPGNGRGWMNLGLAQMEAGDRRAAAQSFDRAVACAPSYALAYVNRAILRRAEGDTAGAGADTEMSLRLDPKNFFVQHWAARHDLAVGDLALAAEHAARASALSPRHVPSLVLAIEIASSQGEEVRLGELLGALEAIGPAADEGRAEAAFHLLTAGRFEAAYPLLASVTARHPDWTTARFNLGYTLLGLGRLPDAEREFQAVLAQDPENAAARQNLLWIAAQDGESIPGHASETVLENASPAPESGNSLFGK